MKIRLTEPRKKSKRKIKRLQTLVSQMRDEKVSTLYKRLRIDFSRQKADKLAVEKRIDMAIRNGIIPGLLTERQRKNEI